MLELCKHSLFLLGSYPPDLIWSFSRILQTVSAQIQQQGLSPKWWNRWGVKKPLPCYEIRRLSGEWGKQGHIWMEQSYNQNDKGAAGGPLSNENTEL
jgi:hypothetical protein